MNKYIAKQADAQGHIYFTPEENETWKILFDRQIELVQSRACAEYLEGFRKLKLPRDHVPQCDEISAVLRAETGWSVVPAAAIIPLEEFFSLLANRQFPAASFIRTRADLDFLQEPDIFHEYFGHCPLLTHQAYADFVQWYGENALKVSKKAQSLLGRLFWFTIEFGLIRSDDGLKIFGGGILSSFAETIYALESESPTRKPFDVERMLKTPYRYDEIQNTYFILNNMEQLFELRHERVLALVGTMLQESQENDFVIC